MRPCREREQECRSRDRVCAPRVIGGAREDVPRGQDQTDRYRREATLDRDAPRRAAPALPDVRDAVGAHRRRAGHGEHGDDAAEHAGNLPADQADDEHVRPRRRLRQREELREVGVGQPVLCLDRAQMDLRDHRVGAADRQQRQHQELRRELDQNRRNHARFHHATPIDTGHSAASIHSSGTRRSAIATKAMLQMTTCHADVLSGRASLSAVAAMSADADADTPLHAPRTASNCANCAYTLARASTTASGISSNPANAAAAPATPWKRRPMMTDTLTMFGPGRNCDSDSTSRNSSSESQRRCSTIMRRAKGITPPNPDKPILRNPTKSSDVLTVAGGPAVEASITPMIGDAARSNHPWQGRIHSAAARASDEGVRMNSHLLMQQPQDQADHHRHDQSGRQWNEEREIIALDANVSRQVSEAELREQGPEEADGDKDDAERDEQT